MLAAELLSAKCWREMRWWQQTVCGIQLLHHTADVTASLEGAQSMAAAWLRISSLGLAHQLLLDAAIAAACGERIPSFIMRPVVNLLGQFLPAICRLAAQVAAARGRNGTAGEASEAAAAAADAADSFGQMCWGHLAGAWYEMLQDLCEGMGCLAALDDFSPHVFADKEATAAAAAAQAMVRLVPLLPLQPALVHSSIHHSMAVVAAADTDGQAGGITTCGALVEAAGGSAAVLSRYLARGGRLLPETTAPLLSRSLPTIAARLLERNSETHTWDEESAFGAYSTACHYSHALQLHGALSGGDQRGAAILADPATAVFQADDLLHTALAGLHPCFADWRGASDGAAAARTQRRVLQPRGAAAAASLQVFIAFLLAAHPASSAITQLVPCITCALLSRVCLRALTVSCALRCRRPECTLLLYLAAVLALPIAHVHDSKNFARFCAIREQSLCALLRQEALAPLWRLLLQLRGSS